MKTLFGLLVLLPLFGAIGCSPLNIRTSKADLPDNVRGVLSTPTATTIAKDNDPFPDYVKSVHYDLPNATEETTNSTTDNFRDISLVEKSPKHPSWIDALPNFDTKRRQTVADSIRFSHPEAHDELIKLVAAFKMIRRHGHNNSGSEIAEMAISTVEEAAFFILFNKDVIK